MIAVVLISVASLLATSHALPYLTPELRVVGGTDASILDYPYTVSLQYDGSHTCGGSIIDEWNVLTAAHCVEREASRFSVLYGSTSLREGRKNNKTIDVESLVYHEKYTGLGAIPYDVAVVHLASPLPLGTPGVEATQLPPQGQATPGDAPGILTGWGLEKTGGSVQDTLQTVEITVYTDDACEYAHRLTGPTDRDYHICAGIPEGGKGQCSGDSGGPLVANGYQVGTVSWSIKPCTVKGYPGVFGKVSSYIDWINSNLKVVALE